MRKLYIASCTMKNDAYPDGFTENRMVVVNRQSVESAKEIVPEWFAVDSNEPKYLNGLSKNDLLNTAYIIANQGFSREYPENKFSSLIVREAFETVTKAPLTII